MGWTVRGSNPGGARFSAPIQTGPGAHPASYTLGTGSFPGVKRPGRSVDHPPHLARGLKKEYNYTSTPPWAFVACSRVTFTFNFTNNNNSSFAIARIHLDSMSWCQIRQHVAVIVASLNLNTKTVQM